MEEQGSNGDGVIWQWGKRANQLVGVLGVFLWERVVCASLLVFVLGRVVGRGLGQFKGHQRHCLQTGHQVAK